MKSNTYELGFVHLDNLISHETCDFNRVCQLADQIKKDGHLKNPVLGVGIGNFAFYAGPSAVPSWSPISHDATDTVVFVTSVYLQTLSEVGIVGLFVLLYLFGTIGRSIMRTVQLSTDETWTATAIGLMGSFLMIVVAVAFIPNFFYPETWVVLGFIAVMFRQVVSDQRRDAITKTGMQAAAH